MADHNAALAKARGNRDGHRGTLRSRMDLYAQSRTAGSRFRMAAVVLEATFTGLGSCEDATRDLLRHLEVHRLSRDAVLVLPLHIRHDHLHHIVSGRDLRQFEAAANRHTL